jgi:hypothetical protein
VWSATRNLSDTSIGSSKLRIVDGGESLRRIIHDGSSRNRAVVTRDRRAEPRGGALPRLGVPKGVRPLVVVGEAGFRAEPAIAAEVLMNNAG